MATWYSQVPSQVFGLWIRWYVTAAPFFITVRLAPKVSLRWSTCALTPDGGLTAPFSLVNRVCIPYGPLASRVTRPNECPSWPVCSTLKCATTPARSPAWSGRIRYRSTGTWICVGANSGELTVTSAVPPPIRLFAGHWLASAWALLHLTARARGSNRAPRTTRSAVVRGFSCARGLSTLRVARDGLPASLGSTVSVAIAPAAAAGTVASASAASAVEGATRRIARNLEHQLCE